MLIAALATAVLLAVQTTPPPKAPTVGTAPPAAKVNTSTLLAMLGTSLVETDGKRINTAEAIKDNTIIALYFSAAWCPPCKKFTPKLVEFVKQNENSKAFTVIFVSSDRSAEEHAKYMKHYKMPFPAMPFDKAQLKQIKQAYGGNGIPNLVLLNADGTVIKGSYETNGTYSPKNRKSYIGPDPVLAELGKLIKQDVKKTA
jgi:nucleoredoxin